MAITARWQAMAEGEGGWVAVLGEADSRERRAGETVRRGRVREPGRRRA